MEKEQTFRQPALADGNLDFFPQAAGIPCLEEQETAECLTLREEWSALLTCKTVAAHGRSFLAVWLDERVDRAVDAAWEESPSRGFLLNAIAQSLCMRAVSGFIPEIDAAGCAPVPEATPELAKKLTAAGLPARVNNGLGFSRRYVVVTPVPFSGKCGICALSPSCPYFES